MCFIKVKKPIRRIGADSYYRRPRCFELFAQVSEVTAFLGSTWRHSLRKKEEDYRA